jgi:hypothetical protein
MVNQIKRIVTTPIVEYSGFLAASPHVGASRATLTVVASGLSPL